MDFYYHQRNISSKYFTGFISKQITKFASNEIGSIVKFERSSIKFFPPGIRIEGVEAKVENINSDIDIMHTVFDSIELNFSLINLFKNQINFKSLIVSGGYILLERGEKKDSNEKGDPKPKISGGLFDWREEVAERIQNLVLKDIKLDFMEDSLYIRNSHVGFKSDVISIESNLQAVSLSGALGKWARNSRVIFDKIEFGLTIGDDLISVDTFGVVLGDNIFSFNGEARGNILELDSLRYSGNIKVESRDQNFIQSIFIEKDDRFHMDSLVQSDFKIWGKGKKYQARGAVDIFNFKNSAIKFHHGKMDFEKKGNNLVIKSFTLKDNSGRLHIKNPFVVFNFSEKKLIPIRMRGEADNIALENIIPIFENPRYKLDSSLSGLFELSLDNGVLSFNSKKLFLKTMNYATEKTSIFKHSNVEVENVSIVFNTRFNRTLIDADFKLGDNKTSFSASGYLGKDTRIKANFNRLDLKNIIDLNGLEFSGVGKGEVDFKLNKQSVLFDIYLDTKKSGFAGYRFGEFKN